MGNVLLFWNAHPKGSFFLGIWEHLLASKMLLGRVKPLPGMGASLKQSNPKLGAFYMV
jgi:hypothetical protein